MKLKSEYIYFDHAAATPVLPEVYAAIKPYLTTIFYNPSGIYQGSQKASAAITAARNSIATYLNCAPSEVIFTSSATEANNLALIGFCLASLNLNKKKLLLSVVEHSSVFGAADFLKRHFGFKYELLSYDEYARLDLNKIKTQLNSEIALVSAAFASSDIGSLQQITDLAELCSEKNIPLHVDASQAPGYFKLDVNKLGCTSLTLSSQKIYGPRGAGLLYKNSAYGLKALINGGGQEFNYRSGTENQAAIVGMATALELTKSQAVYNNITQLTAELKEQLLKQFPSLILTGHPQARLPFHLSFITPNLAAETLLIKLDLAGVACSAGSACSIGKNEAVPILTKLNYNSTQAKQALRITLGRLNKTDDIANFCAILGRIIKP